VLFFFCFWFHPLLFFNGRRRTFVGGTSADKDLNKACSDSVRRRFFSPQLKEVAFHESSASSAVPLFFFFFVLFFCLPRRRHLAPVRVRVSSSAEDCFFLSNIGFSYNYPFLRRRLPEYCGSINKTNFLVSRQFLLSPTEKFIPISLR